MLKSETAQILAVLKRAYPVFYKDISEQEISGIIELWHEMFEADDLRIVASALKTFIANDEKGYPPTVGVIKTQVRKMTQPQEISEMEAWTKVRKAISNGLYHSKEEFDKLPQNIQVLIGSPNVLRDWAMLDVEQLDTVIQSNFMRSFKTKSKEDKEFSMLPESIKKVISPKIERKCLKFQF